MNVLAVDTSTSFASIALAVDEMIVAESLIGTDRTLSIRLLAEIERLVTNAGLTIADIDIFASTIGPGSFTGVRGGVATVQGLALAVDKPCAGFSSLAMLSMNFSCSKTPVCPMLDARKSEVYAALYDCSSGTPTSLINDGVLSPDAFLDQIVKMTDQPVIFIGEGVSRYHDLIAERIGEQAHFAPFPLHTPHVANIIPLALQAFYRQELLESSQLLPVYLRASDAEINRIKAAEMSNKRSEK